MGQFSVPLRLQISFYPAALACKRKKMIALSLSVKTSFIWEGEHWSDRSMFCTQTTLVQSSKPRTRSKFWAQPGVAPPSNDPNNNKSFLTVCLQELWSWPGWIHFSRRVWKDCCKFPIFLLCDGQRQVSVDSNKKGLRVCHSVEDTVEPGKLLYGRLLNIRAWATIKGWRDGNKWGGLALYIVNLILFLGTTYDLPSIYPEAISEHRTRYGPTIPSP